MKLRLVWIRKISHAMLCSSDIQILNICETLLTKYEYLWNTCKLKVYSCGVQKLNKAF